MHNSPRNPQISEQSATVPPRQMLTGPGQMLADGQMLAGLESADSSPDRVVGSDAEAVSLRHRGRLYALLLIAVGLLVVVWVIRPTAAINGEGPAVGQLAPVIELVSICGSRRTGDLDVHLVAHGPVEDSEFKKEILAFNRCEVCLVHFWGTWCGPCRDELPELAEVFEELRKHSDIHFVSVSCASFDDPSLATLHARTCQFYESHGIHLPTYADPSQAVRAELLRMMERPSMAYPTTILIDREGVIRSTWVGVPPGGAETIRKRVLKVLNES